MTRELRVFVALSEGGVEFLLDHVQDFEETLPDRFGIDIDMQSFKGDSILLRGLLAGELDAYIGNPGGPMIAASKGADIKIIGCPWPGLTYALFAKPEIETVVYSPGTLLWRARVSDLARTALMKLASKPVYKQMTVRNLNTTNKVTELLERMQRGINA